MQSVQEPHFDTDCVFVGLGQIVPSLVPSLSPGLAPPRWLTERMNGFPIESTSQELGSLPVLCILPIVASAHQGLIHLVIDSTILVAYRWVQYLRDHAKTFPKK